MPINISEINFDSSELQRTIIDAVNKHINNTVNKFVKNYNLYEETCDAVLKLPILSNNKSEISETEIIKVDERASIIKTDITNNDVYKNEMYLNLLDKFTVLQSDMDKIKKEYDESCKKVESLTKQILELENKTLNSEENDVKLELHVYPVKMEPLPKNTEENISIEIAEAKCEENNDETNLKKYDEILFIEKVTVRKIEEIVINDEEESEEEKADTDEEDNESEEEVQEEKSEEELEELEEEVEESEEDEEEEKVDESEEEVETEEELETEEESEEEDEKAVESEKEEDEKAVESEEEEDEKAVESEEEDEEVFEVEIKGKKYYTNNETNGKIYSIDENGDPDEEIGHFLNSKPVFLKK